MSYEHEWLDLIDISGPFLAVPVLRNAFPQGLDQLDPKNKKRPLRQAYDEWREALDENDPDIAKFHTAWVDLVLKEILELDEDESGEILKPAATLPEKLTSHVLEHGVTLQPDYAVIDDQHADTPLMLIKVYEPDVDLSEAVKGDGWASTPADRMVQLCRDTGTRLGIVTNGEQWMFVDAPVGAVTSFATWYARLWSQEPETLQAFISLFGVRRFFLDKAEQLPALLDQSLQYQDEVTDALGGQVRRAVEVLIQALDRANIDDDGKLLEGINPRELYEAGLTVMMRLVFLLSAEERELLLLGDERYDTNYAVSTLRMQLRAESDEILDRRWDAWSRLLATFRAVYGGIEHETLRMPALGGSLFEPDRFPFLEGRAKDSNWQEEAAHPLPINNHTVLLLLDAIQLYQGRTLSYRGLDIEQLGYVYEGLLDHTVKRAKDVTLELDATKNAKQPWVTLNELTAAKEESAEALVDLLKDRTGSSISRVRNDLKKEVSEEQAERLLTSCQNDPDLREQLKPYFHLIRSDSWDYPLVYTEGSFMVTTGDDRRQTGSHYTPISLTEAIVRETLEPVVYVGPAEGKSREEWQLRSPAELLDLKVCDPAMGSGAFLVQVCRWLGERVVESWEQSEVFGQVVDVDGQVSDKTNNAEPLPKEIEERAIIARRLIAEQCIYGVDLNPLAVELAKLSIWLVTLAKGRPFGFLDHNLKCGDSLLGIQNLDQLTELSLNLSGARQMRIFGQNIRKAVDSALDFRRDLRSTPIRDIHDVEKMASLEALARAQVELPERIADALVGCVLSAESEEVLKGRVDSLAILADKAVQADSDACNDLDRMATIDLAKDVPSGQSRRPFHWPLEFPEVFLRRNGGFDAIVGNPPFMGGQKISGLLGSAYREYLISSIGSGVRGSADLVSYFFLFAFGSLRSRGCFGLIASNTIAQGDSREVGLEQITDRDGAVFSATPNIVWQGKASVVVSVVHVIKGDWTGSTRLSGSEEEYISAYLDPVQVDAKPLGVNDLLFLVTKGSEIGGKYFLLGDAEIEGFLEGKYGSESEFVKWFLNGEDILQSVASVPRRMIVSFGSMDMTEAKARAPKLIGKLERKLPASHRSKWWQYRRPVLKLYKAIEDKSSIIVCGQTGEMWAVKPVPSTYVYSNSAIVFASQSLAAFAILQSSVHEAWKLKFGPTLKLDPRYSISDVFDTFPFPDIDLDDEESRLTHLGQEYDALRDKIVQHEQIGLTDFYKRYHDPACEGLNYTKLRDIDAKISNELGRLYGWQDLDWSHTFNSVHHLFGSNRIRWTIGKETRFRLLQRLVVLNTVQAQKLEKPHVVRDDIQTKLAGEKRPDAPDDSSGQRGLFSSSDQ